MKSLLLLATLLLASTASANGGLSLDTAKQLGIAPAISNNTVIEIATQAPVKKYNAYVSKSLSAVKPDFLRHNFDGQS
jgi:hypothetical protein